MQSYSAKMKISPTQRGLTIALAVIVLNALLYVTPVYRAIGGDIVLAINSLTNIAAGLVSVVLGLRLWRSSRRGESSRFIWASLTTGLIVWMIAEVTWDGYQIVRGIEMPTTSPVDIIWMFGYIAVISGLILRVYTFRMHPTKAWQFTLLAVFGLMAVLAVIYLIVPMLNGSQIDPSYNRYTGLFYAVCDLVMAFLALLLFLVLEGGLLSKPWAMIALACLCIAVSNLFYGYGISQGIYQMDPAAGLNALSYIVDTFYTFAYVLMALGLYLQARVLDAT